MKLYLLRHAIAGERDAVRYPDDRLRPVTPGGRRRMAEAARGMQQLGLAFDAVLTSPLVRARQTAAIVATILGGPEPDLCAALEPGGGLPAILKAIGPGRPDRSVALVGHEPHLSWLAAQLLCVPLASGTRRPGPRLELKKGGLCLIEFDGLPAAGKGRLIFLVRPGMLRALQKR